eukprot:CAMPEP_0167748846 /NCGR_PEP_ID=MMETSP0110_2-20121227/5066_1 /TAXON_ID=629695 /ORGANISM="Gymnochlora sp., Strain CCMP2014" /LENGTH=490 /DNA_ID=CAMNT_0007633909 /DNA_START=273 /DNA_END=1745 /DNA_ORIENTATION=-
MTLKCPSCSLKSRLLMHLHHKSGDGKKTTSYQKSLSNDEESELALAAVEYKRGRYQKALYIYKNVFDKQNGYIALKVYKALCHYQMGAYSTALKLTDSYLKSDPNSRFAANLRASTIFQTKDEAAAKAELSRFASHTGIGESAFDSQMLEHNRRLFELALEPEATQDFASIPVALGNIVTALIRQNDFENAFEIVEDMKLETMQELVVKGVVFSVLGQADYNDDMVNEARNLFLSVGQSPSERNTILGRKCMASYHFLGKEFKEAAVYLESVKKFANNEEHYNLGIALAACERYEEAEVSLLAVEDENYCLEYNYVSWLARCYIHNGKPMSAWNLYTKVYQGPLSTSRALTPTSAETSNAQESNFHDLFHHNVNSFSSLSTNKTRQDSDAESIRVLKLIANDCFKIGHYFVSAKAFNALEKKKPTENHFLGKHAACIGVFEEAMSSVGGVPRERVLEVTMMLHDTANDSRSSHRQQASKTARTIRSWLNL